MGKKEEENGKAASERFMKKLTGKGFVMSRSQNYEKDYTQAKQKRDSRAVAEFSKSETAKYIMTLS